MGITASMIIFVLTISLHSLLHPVHVSVASIEYIPEKEEFAVSFKIFIDDFESIIYRKYGVELKLGKEDEWKDQSVYFDKYIIDSFSFLIDKNRQLVPVYQRKKINEEAIWLYYSYKCRGKIKSVTIRNSLMMDMFDDQTNLLIMKYFHFEKGYQMRKYNQEVMFQFEN